MTEFTVRKLRRTGGNPEKLSYTLLPPKHWIDLVEAEENKKILFMSIKKNNDRLELYPLFEKPDFEAPHNISPDDLLFMLNQGTVVCKLRDIYKNRKLYRCINIPRVWVRLIERKNKRKITALRLFLKRRRIDVLPTFEN